MKIEKSRDGSGFVLSNNVGALLQVSFDEFWEICRYGNEIDTRSEVEEYLSQCPEIGGHDVDKLMDIPAFVDMVVEQVIQDRISNENGDQIYEAVSKCIKSSMVEIEIGTSSLDAQIRRAADYQDPVDTSARMPDRGFEPGR